MTMRSLILTGIVAIAGLGGCTAESPDGGAKTSPVENAESVEGSDAQSVEGSDTQTGAERPAEGSGN